MMNLASLFKSKSKSIPPQPPPHSSSRSSPPSHSSSVNPPTYRDRGDRYFSRSTMQQFMNHRPNTCTTQARNPGSNRGKTQACVLCEHCRQRPKFTDGIKVHPYCGLRCAELATNSHLAQAIVPMYLRVYGCIICRVAPAPMIISVPEEHKRYKSVEMQFKQSWRHKTKCPEVRAIYKIIGTEESLGKYQRHLDSVESKGNFIAKGNSRGNERRRWHGTKRECRLGDPGHLTFCAQAGCSLCCIIKSSFDLNFFKSNTRWGKFGRGIYTSSTSSKSNHYSENVGFTSDWKALLLNKVVVGNGKKLTKSNNSLTKPPPGYDSVLGVVVPGGALNYDELVVYKNEAIRPSYLIMYKSS